MKKRIIVFIFIFFIFIIPILITPFPPVTDLPQHLSQIHLLLETLKTDSGLYKIQWTAPNTFVYIFIYLFWQILPTALVGKTILILMILFWMLAIHILSEKREIPIESAILASLLVFNLSFYWGFLNFLVGFPFFIAWFTLTSKDRPNPSIREILQLLALSFFLYLSHVLWFVVGVAWMCLINLIKKTQWKLFSLRLAALIPSVVLALTWFIRFKSTRASSGFETAPQWPSLPFRLSFGNFLNSAFGGITGPAEFLVFCFICLWTVLLIWKNRKRLNILFDKESLLAGLFFLSIFLLAPSTFLNTIYFSSRWFAIAVIFFIISLRLPLSDNPRVKAIPVFIAFAFVMLTSIAWHNFDRKDLAGFKESLAHIPPGSTVLGLDTVRRSGYLKGVPFFQIFSYAQAFKGCELSFSFAEHGTGIVAFKEPRKTPWTTRLEWYPERTKKSDLRFFDYVLANTDQNTEKHLLETEELVQLTSTGFWQLYKVQSSEMESGTEMTQDEYLFFNATVKTNK